nr:integrase, catalytic region, zinc finger, CCHC-type, peptidase aspartic, catalytic [Tanacetum cinerariifolium]
AIIRSSLFRRFIRVFPSGDLYASFRQKNTLAEYMILSGADNRPPILDKDLVAKDLWERVQLLMQGLSTDICSLVNHHRVAKDLWERVQLLMQGESLHTYYLRFTQLINDMNIYKMNMEPSQVNTKFLNSLPLEWSKFVTDIKLVKDLHASNYDQLHAYLEQHEIHANEVRIMRERNQDLLAFVANQ